MKGICIKIMMAGVEKSTKIFPLSNWEEICHGNLEVVSKPQIRFEGKAPADEKAQHTW